MTNMTYAMALETAINFLNENIQYGDDFSATVEKLEALKVQLAKRNKSERKPTKTQVENDAFKAAIVEYLTMVDTSKTIKELQAEIPDLTNLTNQRIAHMLTDLVNAKTLTKEYIKKTPYYSIAA